METNKIDIRSLDTEEIKEILKGYSVEPYRAGQIFKWLYSGVDEFSHMTNLSKPLRETLNEIFYIDRPLEIDSISSKTDETTKYLFTLSDNEYVESVLLKYKHGYSVCLSTQVGCKMGCNFCASSKLGFTRNLRPGEILNQIEFITRDKKTSNPDFRVSHVVLMGIGEPLDNYDSVLKFLRLVNDKNGYGIGYRNISLSTCGLVDKILRLADENLPVTLSVSLHAPNDKIRNELMPVNKKYPINKLINACKTYIEKTSRRISFEYALISGVNDSPECAKELATLLKGMLCHVNLIPLNETDENNYLRGSKESVNLFTNVLENSKINTTVRRTLGADINAACGQLRRKKYL